MMAYLKKNYHDDEFRFDLFSYNIVLVRVNISIENIWPWLTYSLHFNVVSALNIDL